MSAIAGTWNVSRGAFTPPLSRLLQSQFPYGPDSQDWLERDDFACGRCLFRILAEDRFDRQPVVCPEERFLLVADIRIDNRDEVEPQLGLDRSEAATTSDSALLLRSWLAWGEAALGRIHGDFAFALYDRRAELLVLARDTAGERPLFYLQDRGVFGFASMPQALAACFGQGLNEQRLAEFVSDLPYIGEESFFEKVRRIEPGHVLRVSRRDLTIRRYWEPSRRELRLPNVQAYGEALREEIDRAVARKLRRASGGIATHLSSGFDSSAVTSSAAIQSASRGEEVLAFTAAPAIDIGPAPARRFADESEIAAATTRLHSNLRHRIVRVTADPLERLGDAHRLGGQPVGSIFNNNWWQAIDSQAAQEGATILLTGEGGNFTLSAGRGLTPLADLFRTGRLLGLAHEMRCLHPEYGWLNLANAAFGGTLPKGLYRLGQKLTGRDTQKADAFELLTAEWKRLVAKRHRQAGWDWRPPIDSRKRRWQLLQMADPATFRKMALARWRIEERDPTADRRLVEFSFSLPAEALLKDGVDRPALRAALAGRVAAEVLTTRLRGFQSADWHRLVDPARLVKFIDSRGAANRVVDLESLRAAVAAWPRSDWEKRPVIYRYAIDVMRALAALDFAEVAAGLCPQQT
ncbi:MAG TPA: asparagine synthase-related protein [Allosphingosinicella sp.]|nr:asparagine synthase-related protein [Allosphingosinicella sp.]